MTAVDGVELDAFGVAVAYSNDTICIGQGTSDSASQSVYVFNRSGTTWSPQAKFTGSQSFPVSLFGLLIDYQDDVALITAPLEEGFRGAVYVFTRNGTTWSEQKRWEASDAAPMNAFGFGVARDGDTILVGSIALLTQTGKVYVYNVEEEATQPQGVGGEVSAVNRAGVVWPGLVLILLTTATGALWWSRRGKTE